MSDTELERLAQAWQRGVDDAAQRIASARERTRERSRGLQDALSELAFLKNPYTFAPQPNPNPKDEAENQERQIP